ncbi:MAG TPA: tetratricopeptide repeat protein [Bradyrhizobium sp.]|nr:tetratricopeptide repeat protein [Bradyrhizobium sp.]
MSAPWKNAARTPNLPRLQRQAYNSYQEGHLDKAERLCAGILEYRPDDFDALQLLGVLNLQRRRPGEALRFLVKALKVNSGSADAMSNLGLALHASGRFDEAVTHFRNALLLAPSHPEILYNLGNACLELGLIDEALASYDDVLAKNPDHAGALVNRGNTLLRFNRPVEAMSSYDKALAAMPGHQQILTNRGHALRRLDRPTEALVDFEAALVRSAEFAEAHFEAAMTRLTLGDFAAGWKEYEWRWKTGAFAGKRRHFKAPLWLGDAPVAGKTILLHAEQGLGDTLQFIRYAPLLAGRGAKVVCEVQAELRALLSQFEGIDVVAEGEPLPAFDLHCPLLSLPLAFATLIETIPASVPYLAAPAERLAYWRDRLPQGPRAGFVWSGSATHKNDRNRSIPLARLAALFTDPALRCFSLQGELREIDKETLAGLPNLVDLGGELCDFIDTAAVISLLDIVVSVDTSVAHLAGALGKPVVVLLPFAADFRWMRNRGDTPWYPTARLIRQQAFGDWDGVIARLGDELRAVAPGV